MNRSTVGSAPLSVLLVEDNPGDARLFEELLNEGELEAECRWTSTLQEGLQSARAETPDIAAVDLELPDSEGLETVRAVVDAVPDIPLIVTTGLDDLETATEALEVGASEYLRKDGLTPALLARTLRMAIERHRLQRAADRQRRLSRSILESLPEHIAVLDAEGSIVATNQAWRDFAEAEGGDPRGYVGGSYLEETETAAANGSGDAIEMTRGLRSVLNGARQHFEMEYPCHDPDEKRWFRVSVVPLEAEGRSGVVVSHVNITARKLAEREVRRSHDRHVRAQQMASLGHWEMDLAANSFRASDEVKRILGLDVYADLDAAEFLGRIHPDDRGPLRGLVNELSEGEASSFDEVVRALRPEGEVRLLQHRAARRDGRVTATIQDVTERVRRQRELEAATSSLRERVKEQACLYDVSQLLHADDRPLGERLQDVADRLPQGWQYPEVAASRIELDGEAWSSAGFAATEHTLSAEIVVDGKQVGRLAVGYLEDRPEEDIGPFIDEEEKLLQAVAGQVEMAVERRRTRRELDAERERLAEVFENAPSWVATLRGPEHVFEMANPAYHELVGERQVVGLPVREVFPELEGEGYLELLDHVYETGETVEVEERSLPLETTEGTEQRYITFVYQPRREDGEVVGVIAHGVDVTEQVKKRREAEQAEERWASVVELAPTGIAISDVESGEYRAVNEATADILGYDTSELVGRSAAELDITIEENRRAELIEKVRAEGGVRNESLKVRDRSGETRYLRWSARLLERGGREVLFQTAQEVTEERKQARALERSEARYRRIFSNSVAGIYRSRPGGEILDCNPAFADMFGFESVGDAVGTHGDDLFFSPEERQRDHRRVAEQEDVRTRELRLRRQDGEPIWALVSSVMAEDPDSGEPVLHGAAIDITERKQAQRRYRRLFEQSVAGVFRSEHGGAGRILDCNQAFADILGFEDPDELIGTSADVLYPESDGREEFSRALEDDGRMFSEAYELVRHDGSSVWVMGETRLIEDPERGPSGDEAIREGILFDVSERMQARRDLQEREERFRQMAENIEEAFWLRDPVNSEIHYVSPAYEEIWGRSVEELYEDPAQWISAVHPEDQGALRQLVEAGQTAFDIEYRVIRPDGEVRWVQDQGFPVSGSDGTTRRVAGVARDVTERKRLEKQRRHQALHDPLTGLANRTLLADRAEQGLARARRRGDAIGLLILDIVRFKRVNDRLGHTAGDRVLETMTGRLQEVVREEDTLARWGGDEFVLVLPDLEGSDGLTACWERIEGALEAPIEIRGETVPLDIRAGAVLSGSLDAALTVEAEDAEELLRFGDLALQKAKERGAGTLHLMEPGEQGEGVGALRRERQLRRGIRNDEFVPHYQPVVRLEDGEAVGVEALARWHKPDEGVLSPGAFLPLAEELGLMNQLGDGVLRKACRDASSWDVREPPAAPLQVSVNLSAQQLDNPDLPHLLDGWLDEAGLPPERLVLEVTETSVMHSPGVVEELRDLGPKIYLDDFGTGYSTFSYLRDLEVDGLKIDRSFVMHLGESSEDEALVETMITLAERLGLTLVAEGVETEEQRFRLMEMGCRLGQGYLFDRPMPAQDLESTLP